MTKQSDNSSARDSNLCPYVDDMHEECDISELNSMTIEVITNRCGMGNYRDCRIYRDLASGCSDGNDSNTDI